MSLETADDIRTFFDTDDFGTAARIVLTQSPLTVRTVNVIFNVESDAVAVYPDTEVETPEPSFLAMTMDIVGIGRGMRVTFPNLEAHEDGYGKTYEVTPKVRNEGANASRVYLKEI